MLKKLNHPKGNLTILHLKKILVEILGSAQFDSSTAEMIKRAGFNGTRGIRICNSFPRTNVMI
jgi:hypothetical protein